ncbi:Rhodopsin kinase 1 [Liparis tanakae]|uniref:G protein-coupled receptor kinase n=1 Tax=Liparis tanakae TaxID=230148 RepID=A0A4Z2HY50_9TELE|nr:Rhodopsin kinase 1 [Liparis tanakae]
MCDMGGLDNLVANTAYLKAQGGDDKEMKKRRRSLALPRAEQCATLRSSLDKDFTLLCERQPIGKKFFRQFLANNADFKLAVDFLDELCDWDLAESATKEKAKKTMLSKYFKADSKSFLSFLTGDALEKCKTVTDANFEEVVKSKIQEGVRDFLKDKPFSDYQASPFFDKFLQWKEYEKQIITDKYFYEFRTLGKGGFGEVCAVQVKNTGQMYACKKLCKKRLKKKGGEKMALLEKQILEKVNSLFLVNLGYAYDTKTHLCLVMTLMNGGDLRYHIYNMGYDGKGAGTGAYMAPELLTKTPYRTSVDWWALGCSIYEMVAGYTPFKGPESKKEKVEKEEVQRRIIGEEPKWEHKCFDAPTKDIIQLFLKKKIEERLGIRNNLEDPRKHEWFKKINFPRLEAGLVDPPWVPKPNVVYAKDTDDIAEFSEIKGIEFDANDNKFFTEFSTGAVPIQWQQEMLETGLFDELNDPNRKEGGGDPDGDKKSGTCIGLNTIVFLGATQVDRGCSLTLRDDLMWQDLGTVKDTAAAPQGAVGAGWMEVLRNHSRQKKRKIQKGEMLKASPTSSVSLLLFTRIPLCSLAPPCGYVSKGGPKMIKPGTLLGQTRTPTPTMSQQKPASILWFPFLSERSVCTVSIAIPHHYAAPCEVELDTVSSPGGLTHILAIAVKSCLLFYSTTLILKVTRPRNLSLSSLLRRSVPSTRHSTGSSLL